MSETKTEEDKRIDNVFCDAEDLTEKDVMLEMLRKLHRVEERLEWINSNVIDVEAAVNGLDI